MLGRGSSGVGDGQVAEAHADDQVQRHLVQPLGVLVGPLTMRARAASSAVRVGQHRAPRPACSM